MDPSQTPSSWTPADLNALGRDHLPGHLGVEFTGVGEGWLESRLAIKPWHLAPNGYLHAAVVVGLADTSCGYGCRRAMPPGVSGFTTVELKTNFVATATAGAILCRAQILHGGRSTQLWDASVRDEGGRLLALFRCTQFLLGAP